MLSTYSKQNANGISVMLEAQLVPAEIDCFMQLQEQGRNAVRPQLMRHSAGLMRFIASATLILIIAEPTHATAQTRCEAKRQSCTAECYARYFTIDPKRNECVARCMSEENKCRHEQAAHEAKSYASCNPAVSQTNHEQNSFAGC